MARTPIGETLSRLARNYPGLDSAWRRAASKSSEEVAAYTADLPPFCPHGMADPEGCPDCQAPITGPSPSARMRIPSRLAAATIESWEPAPPAKVVRYVAEWPPRPANAWLGGSIGTGKSHLAVGILVAAYERYGVLGQFWRATDIAEAYRAAANPERGEYGLSSADLDRGFTSTPLLVVDDLGAERATEFSDAVLFRIVDARYSGEMPTVVTTNVAPESVDARLRSRLMSGIEVRFTGKDRRLQ